MLPQSPAQASQAIEAAIQRRIGERFKVLLEQKHLYQSIDVAIDDVVEPHTKNVMDGNRFEQLKFHGARFFAGRWVLVDPSLPGPASKALEPDRVCTVLVPIIKTFCALPTCNRIEPFNLVAATDFLIVGRYSDEKYQLGAARIQNFVLSFLCQACKRVPEVFLVRRLSAKLTLCGRSPIEHVEVANFIPAEAKPYISGAIVAHQSGQTLAGLFLLRTSIEQWIRALGADHEKADQAIDWYMSTLPTDFKSWTPSLREIYGDLSNAMHKAEASVPLFDKAKADIEKHFDARRIRGLPLPKYEPPKS
jgi:hypothetical protein